MAHEFTKITSADLQDKGVVGLPDTPALSTTAMQEKFDEIAVDVIVPKFNNLVDELEDEIGDAVNSDNITNIKKSVDNTLQVSTDGGSTYNELSSSGHIIMTGSGASMPQRSRLQFSANGTITDDAEHNTTFVSLPSGQKGDKGDAGTITVGTVVPGETAQVTNSGSKTDAIFNFTLPKGDQGDSATIQVGTVTKGENASVTNRGTASAAIFDFVLPKGDQGEQGQGINILGEYATLEDLEAAHPTGNAGNAYMVGTENPKDLYVWDVDEAEWANEGQLQGVKGDQGDAGTITIGTVTEGNTMAVENVGTAENAVLNFTLKKGDQGVQGNAATVSVGTVTRGDNPSVTNSGTPNAAVFDFVLPKGDKGDKGDPTTVNNKTGENITLYPTDLYMVGYSKPSSTSPIAVTDNVQQAIGKLEKKADNDIANHTSKGSATQPVYFDANGVAQPTTYALNNVGSLSYTVVSTW